MRRPPPDRIALALLTLLVAIAFFDVLFLGEGLVRGDLFRYHYPMKRIVRETILAGEFPWWNRFYSGGQPMAANPAYEIFYPGQWPILLGSYRFGFNLHIVLHVWIALAGMYLFLRALPLSIVAAAAGAVSFAFGGFFLGSLSTLPACFVWSWTPLLLFALLRFERHRRPIDFLFASAVLAMQFLAGEPVSLLLNLLLAGAATLWKTSRRSSAVGPLKAAGWLAALVAAALALAAVQIVPAFDHLRDTARAEGLDFASVLDFSTPPGRAIEMLFPFFYGHQHESGSYFWGLASFGRSPYFPSIYPGLLAAAGFLASFFVVPRHAAAVLAFCTPSYAIALGRHTPLFGALYDLGLASWFRYPGKFLAIVIVPIAVLGAFTLDRFLAGERRARMALIGTAAGIVIAAAALSAIALSGAYGRWFARHWKLSPGSGTEWLIHVSRSDWFAAAIFATALLLLLLLRGRVRNGAWIVLLGGFVAIDLYRLHRELIVTMPPRFFRAPGIAAALPEAWRDYGVFHLGDWYADATSGGYSHLGDRFYWIERNALIPPTAGAWGLVSALERDYDETFLEPTREMLRAMVLANRRAFTTPMSWQPFAAMANVRYVLDYRPFEDVARECRGDFSRSRPVTVRRTLADYARYRFATQLIEAPGWRGVVDEALRRKPDPGTVYVEGPAFAPANGRVIRVAETSSRAILDVETDGRALLLMTVTRHRHWSVEIDGRPAAVVPANIAFQGVIVPPGRHRIVMRYRNPFVIAGGAVSAIAFAAMALAAGGIAWKRTNG